LLKTHSPLYSDGDGCGVLKELFWAQAISLLKTSDIPLSSPQEQWSFLFTGLFCCQRLPLLLRILSIYRKRYLNIFFLCKFSEETFEFDVLSFIFLLF
jgi:hypothetical protein